MITLNSLIPEALQQHDSYRRLVITTDNQPGVEKEINRIITFHKPDFPDLKIDFKKAIKPGVIVIDLNGGGADSMANKLKDVVVKLKGKIVIKKERTLVKEIGLGGGSQENMGDDYGLFGNDKTNIKEELHEILMNLNRGRIPVDEAYELILQLFHH